MLGLLWNAGETRVKCRNEFHRNADVIRPLVSQESFRRKRWRKGMCLTVHTGNQKSASTSWNRGQDSRGIEVLPFLRLSYDRRFPTFFLCLPREPKRAWSCNAILMGAPGTCYLLDLSFCKMKATSISSEQQHGTNQAKIYGRYELK